MKLKHKLIFPEDFKSKAKRLYPDCDELHQILDAGVDEMSIANFRKVCDYLFVANEPHYLCYKILKATSLEKLQNEVRPVVEKYELDQEFWNIYMEDEYWRSL